jgi:hypothetical protein
MWWVPYEPTLSVWSGRRVDLVLQKQRLRQVVIDEDEIVGANVRHVLQAARVQIVDADDPMPLREQVVAEMRAEEARTASGDRRAHGSE